MAAINLYQHSIDVILANQASSGAYLASPSFSSYVYSWLRDGSFIAHAMDRASQPDSAAQYFRWVSCTLQKQAHKIDAIEQGLAKGKPALEIDFLHTRYTVDGDEVTADKNWGNFQPDGYGTWLWSLAEHVRLTGDLELLHEVWESVLLTVRFLISVWRLPTYDCWEENPEYIHPYTLGAIYAGLQATRYLAGAVGKPDQLVGVTENAEMIRNYLYTAGVRGGRIIKSILPNGFGPSQKDRIVAGVDASLLALGIPYQVFDLHDPVFQATMQQIEKTLRYPDGGVYRYREDTFYGGGEWLLLAGMLGWQAARLGDALKAHNLLEWIASQADAKGNLPEQVSGHVLFPRYLPEWEARWGKVACPLLWSHAMYLILYQAISENIS